MTTRILTVGSKSSTVPPLLHSGSKEASSFLWTQELQRVATLVRGYYVLYDVHLSHNCSASGTVKKVIEINPYLLGTMAGGAGASNL